MRSPEQVATGDPLLIKVAQGSVTATVTDGLKGRTRRTTRSVIAPGRSGLAALDRGNQPDRPPAENLPRASRSGGDARHGIDPTFRVRDKIFAMAERSEDASRLPARRRPAARWCWSALTRSASSCRLMSARRAGSGCGSTAARLGRGREGCEAKLPPHRPEEARGDAQIERAGREPALRRSPAAQAADRFCFLLFLVRQIPPGRRPAARDLRRVAGGESCPSAPDSSSSSLSSGSGPRECQLFPGFRGAGLDVLALRCRSAAAAVRIGVLAATRQIGSFAVLPCRGRRSWNAHARHSLVASAKFERLHAPAVPVTAGRAC